MNFEEFKESYINNLKNADEAVGTAQEFLNSVEDVFNKNIAYEAKIKELEDKNNDLRDSNIKLLMRETNSINNLKDDTEERQERINDYKQQILQGGIF